MTLKELTEPQRARAFHELTVSAPLCPIPVLKVEVALGPAFRAKEPATLYVLLDT